MPRVGFEPTISAGERPKTYALDRTVTGTGETCTFSLPKHTKEDESRDICRTYFSVILMIMW